MATPVSIFTPSALRHSGRALVEMRKLTHAILSCFIFCLLWALFTLQSSRDTRYNSDLGIRPSDMSLESNAEWSLPLTVVAWVFCEVGLVVVSRYVGKKNAQKRS